MMKGELSGKINDGRRIVRGRDIKGGKSLDIIMLKWQEGFYPGAELPGIHIYIHTYTMLEYNYTLSVITVQSHKWCASNRSCNKSQARPARKSRSRHSMPLQGPVLRRPRSLCTLTGSSHKTWRRCRGRHNRSCRGKIWTHLEHDKVSFALIST